MAVLDNSERICSSDSSKDTATLKENFQIKRGVVIFGLFAVEKNFGIHSKLFLGVILP